MSTVAVERWKIEEWVVTTNRRLRATDKRFSHTVHVIHEDGSIFFIRNAFIVKRGKWVIVFSEHHGTFCWDKDDLYDCIELGKRVK